MVGVTSGCGDGFLFLLFCIALSVWSVVMVTAWPVSLVVVRLTILLFLLVVCLTVLMNFLLNRLAICCGLLMGSLLKDMALLG